MIETPDPLTPDDFTADQFVGAINDALREHNVEAVPVLIKMLAVKDPHRAQEVLDTIDLGVTLTADTHTENPSAEPTSGTEAAEIYRPVRRGVLHLSTQLLEQILGLPDDVEVLHIAPGHHGLSLAVIVTSPDLPEVDPACAPYELMPSFALVDGRPQLLDLGIPKAAST